MTHMKSCTAWEACEAIRQVGDSTVHHSKGWGGTAVATMVQGPQHFTTDPQPFHLLEMTLSGTMDGHNRFDGLLGGGDAFYRPNSLCYVPQGRGVDAGTHAGSAELMHLYLDDRVFRDLAGETLKGPVETLDLYGINNHYDQRIAGLMRIILTELNDPSETSDLMSDMATQQIAILLMRLSADARSRAKTLPRSRLDDRDYARAVDQIEANLGNALSLGDLAGALGMSVYAFSRAFKTSSGMAPHQYLTQRRIERVKTRLAETNDSLAGIAYDAGFSSQAHMTTAFKKIVGATPGAFRRALRG